MTAKLSPSERLNLLNKYRILAAGNTNTRTHVVLRTDRRLDAETPETAEPGEAAGKLRTGSRRS